MSDDSQNPNQDTTADEPLPRTREELAARDARIRNSVYAEARKTLLGKRAEPEVAPAPAGTHNTPIANVTDVAAIVSQSVAATLAALGRPEVSTVPTAPKPNISDKGPATPSSTRDAEAIYEHRPLDATHDDFDRLVVKHGREKALDIASRNINAYLRTVRLVPDNHGRRR